jgi:hypothetical protein
VTEDEIKALRLSEKPTRPLPFNGKEAIPAGYRVEGLPEGFGAEVYIHEINSRHPWAFWIYPSQFLDPPRFRDKDAALGGLRAWWRRNQPDFRRNDGA